MNGAGQIGGVYVISEITVTDDEAYERYRKKVRPVIESFGEPTFVRAGAKFVTDNATSGLLNSKGGWNPDQIVVLHFDTAAQVAECFSSPEYKAAFALRDGGASGRSLIVNAFRPDD